MKDGENQNFYIISKNRNEKLLEQMEWVDEVVNKELIFKPNKSAISFSLSRGRIYKYLNKVTIYNKSVIQYCLILADSTRYDSKVLVCPLYPIDNETAKLGINIGIIPQIDCNHELVACLHEINFINKLRLKINHDEQSNNEIKPVCCINKETYVKVMKSYKDFVATIVETNTKTCVSYKTKDNNVAYRC